MKTVFSWRTFVRSIDYESTIDADQYQVVFSKWDEAAWSSAKLLSVGCLPPGRQCDQSFSPRPLFYAGSLRWVINCKFGKAECFENGASLLAMEGQFFSAGHADIYP
jgi:hypothetical protein